MTTVHTFLLTVEVPESTPRDATLFMAGDFNAWSPSHPRFRLQHLKGRIYAITLPVTDSEVRFKITRGSWETAEVTVDGDPVADHVWSADEDDEPIVLDIAAWLDQHPQAIRHKPRHTLCGDIRVLKDVYSRLLDNFRDVYVYLPPGYEKSPTRRYPVIYAHDGQNLFDDVTAYAGEWQLDEVCEKLAAEEGIEFMVVAIPNTGRERLNEYGPWHDTTTGLGGRGADYVNWIAHDLKAEIDERFRTIKTRAATAMLGSSMGGLISLYAGLIMPQTFGVVAALSPTVTFAGGRLFAEVTDHANREMNVYIDQGGQEYPGMRLRCQRLVEATEKLAGCYVKAAARVQLVIDPLALHNEAAWTKRLPGVLRFIWSCVEH